MVRGVMPTAVATNTRWTHDPDDWKSVLLFVTLDV